MTLKPPRIAVPVPHSTDNEYSARTLARFSACLSALCKGVDLVAIQLDHSNLHELERCHGLLLPGTSTDIDPPRYGAIAGSTTIEPDTARDTMDDLLLKRAFDCLLPILGVCHGLQALNIFTGGSLLQNIASEEIDHRLGEDGRIAHSVELESTGIMLPLFTKHAPLDRTLPVNSNHHQAVLVTGSGLRVCARSRDGIIEAVEGEDSRHFVLGVQWHPEALSTGSDAGDGIFSAFLAAARRWMEGSKPGRRR
jgi:putative glutamine amidotransferase